MLTLMQIRFILLQNRQGKTRLSKWYVHYDENEKVKLQSEIHRMIVMRDTKHTNFLEVPYTLTKFRNFKIIYKRYAGLYFALCVDINDNELTHLQVGFSLIQLIHLFVETMDQYFGNVCELDIVFNFHKVYGILDEIILGG